MTNQIPRINYFLATWSGSRRPGHTEGGNLTYQHLQYLGKLNHQLSQITVGWPSCSTESQDYVDWMNGIDGTKIGGATVVVERMKNKGYSYGQYSKMFSKHSDFDYYIFTEDDYVPVQHDFDAELVRMYNQLDCGYLCGMVRTVNFRRLGSSDDDSPLHAAISWGISSKNVLDDIVAKTGSIYDKKTRLHSQIAFSLTFMNAGYEIHDVMESYCCPYFQKETNIEYFGNPDNPVLIVPIQYAIQRNFFDFVPSTPFPLRK